MIQWSYKMARRIAIGLVGATVLLFGVIMIVTPGPALIVIPLGLAILGLEFAWARYWLKRLRAAISRRGAAGRAESAEGHRSRATDSY